MTMHRALATITVGAVVLTGCGGSGSDSSASSERSTTSSATTPTADCPASDGPAITGRSVVELRSGGEDRSYVRYVPEGSDATEPAPIIVDLTAYSPASMEEAFSGWTTARTDGSVKADEIGAVVLTPEPVNGSGLLTWNVDDTPGWTDDPAFLVDVLDDAAATLCTDPGRVLVTGFAIGGVMASRFACDHADRVTAVATVSGLWDPTACEPSRPVPVLSFHGNDDHFLPYDGGIGDHVGELGLTAETSEGLVAMADRPGASDSSQAWADRNGCDPEPATMPNPAGETRAWSNCDDGGDVVLWTVTGGSHTWPGSTGMGPYEDLLGPVNDEVDATEVIWSWFEDEVSGR